MKIENHINNLTVHKQPNYSYNGSTSHNITLTVGCFLSNHIKLYILRWGGGGGELIYLKMCHWAAGQVIDSQQQNMNLLLS